MWQPQRGLLKTGNRVLFGQMYEDVEIEMRAFRQRNRVFCIASAGDSAIALAGSHQVTAVDINAAQLAYARHRAAGHPALPGSAERARSAGLRLMSLAGWTAERIRNFLLLEDCREQIDFWHDTLNTRRFRIFFDSIIRASLALVRRLSPDPLSLPRANFGPLLRSRVERSLARFPNHTNPHAWRLFTTRLSHPYPPPCSPIHFEHADAADFLFACPERSFDAFTLSNIVDGVTPDYARRLKDAVRHAAAPDAVVVMRSFREPQNAAERALAAEDRAMIWGSIYSGPVSAF